MIQLQKTNALYQQIASDLAGCRPDDLLVANDGAFRGALYALLELGVKIPDAIKLVVYANLCQQGPRGVLPLAVDQVGSGSCRLRVPGVQWNHRLNRRA
jgi:hypothetical protein